MRLVLAAALAFAVALPAAAQAQFAAACAASVAADDASGLDAATVCGCATDATLAQGVAGADLDAALDVLEDRAEAPTPGAVRAAEVATESLMRCAVQGLVAQEAAGTLAPSAGMESAPVAAGGVPLAPGGASGADRRPLPPGLSTGDGLRNAEGRRTGPGAAIRIK